MARVIILSRTFPSYHINAGKNTFFVEKFYNSLFSRNNLMDYPKGIEVNESILEMKNHTIRSGHRFKKGQYFSPRVWSGKPYNSKQIIIAPDTLITNTYNFRIDKYGSIFINDKHYAYYGDICLNDGLSPEDFRSWFKMKNNDGLMPEFDGQIIVWRDVKY